MAKREKMKNSKHSEKGKSDTIAYRLKCAKTANGLSHFVMYGDAPKKKTLL
ncbi:MAG: hypothetical protein AAB456_03590 [Patescibacteria group bacterium]